jgi:hypothetical protein
MYDKEEADNLAFQKGPQCEKSSWQRDPLVKSQPNPPFSLN